MNNGCFVYLGLTTFTAYVIATYRVYIRDPGPGKDDQINTYTYTRCTSRVDSRYRIYSNSRRSYE